MFGFTQRLLSVCLLILACLAPAVIAEDKKNCGCEYCLLKVCDCGCDKTPVALSKQNLGTEYAALPIISDRIVAKYQAAEPQASSCANGSCSQVVSSGTVGSCSQGNCSTSQSFVSSPTAYQGQPEFRESRRSRRGSRGSCRSGGCG